MPNLQLSEILQDLVDRGELSEGSPDYLLAQKAVRDGFDALSPEEQAAFHSRLEPRLGAAWREPPPPPGGKHGPPPFPPAELVSKRAGG